MIQQHLIRRLLSHQVSQYRNFISISTIFQQVQQAAPQETPKKPVWKDISHQFRIHRLRGGTDVGGVVSSRAGVSNCGGGPTLAGGMFPGATPVDPLQLARSSVRS